MSNYRRARRPGGTWFFTVNLRNRRDDLLVRHVDELRRAFAETRKDLPFRIDALVVLPDHLHAVLALPVGDTDFAARWKGIKARFSKALPRTEPRTFVNESRGERGIWQRRYWEHLIRDGEDFRRHVEYCWINPVKHGHVARVRDWPHSSFHRDLRRGLALEDFGGDRSELAMTGERR